MLLLALQSAAPAWSLVQATSQRRWLWVAFQPASNELTFAVFLEWSGGVVCHSSSLSTVPPVAVLLSLHTGLCNTAVCSTNCLWEQKSSDPSLCLSACQLCPSLQALGGPVSISDLEAGPFQLHQHRRGGSLPRDLDFQLHPFSCAGSGCLIPGHRCLCSVLLAAGSFLESGPCCSQQSIFWWRGLSGRQGHKL